MQLLPQAWKRYGLSTIYSEEDLMTTNKATQSGILSQCGKTLSSRRKEKDLHLKIKHSAESWQSRAELQSLAKAQ